MPSSDPAANESQLPVPPTLTLHHPGRDARVRFHWNSDRYEHVVVSGDQQLATIDQQPHAPWPDCPPLQQLSLETIADREVALGVGCAGTSHWSVSVEPTERGFRFDWACRTKQPPQQLGIAYAVSDGFEFHPGEATQIQSQRETRTLAPQQRLDEIGTFRWQYEVII